LFIFCIFSPCCSPSMRFRQRNHPERHQRNSIATPAKNIFLLFLPILRLMPFFLSEFSTAFHRHFILHNFSDCWLKYSTLKHTVCIIQYRCPYRCFAYQWRSLLYCTFSNVYHAAYTHYRAYIVQRITEAKIKGDFCCAEYVN